MTIQIELSPQAEARLTVDALAHGLAPDKYAGALLQEALLPVGAARQLSVQQFHVMLDTLGQGSENLPLLPTESFTRESFYREQA